MGREHRFVQNVQKLLASSYLICDTNYIKCSYFWWKIVYFFKNWMFSTNQRYFLKPVCQAFGSSKKIKLHSFGKAKHHVYQIWLAGCLKMVITFFAIRFGNVIRSFPDQVNFWNFWYMIDNVPLPVLTHFSNHWFAASSNIFTILIQNITLHGVHIVYLII